MAELICNLKEFTYFVDPRVRNNVATMTKKSKSKIEYKCQKCNEKKELDAAHKHGSTRKEIIKKVLDNYKTDDDLYQIKDLQKVVDEISKAHYPIEDHFIFLCKTCHREYDSFTKNLNEDEIPNNSYQNKPSNKINEIVTPKISPSTNLNTSNSKEIGSKSETSSWKYKMSWTSIKNRKNIEGLIIKIESTLECQPLAVKSWYYHKRKDNNKQFSGIICHKDHSLMCFRVEPKSFDITDSRIISGKRWFFSEGNEKRIEIIPENYDLIMKCLDYACSISKY